jgi:hypothetical protein
MVSWMFHADAHRSARTICFVPIWKTMLRAIVQVWTVSKHKLEYSTAYARPSTFLTVLFLFEDSALFVDIDIEELKANKLYARLAKTYKKKVNRLDKEADKVSTTFNRPIDLCSDWRPRSD